MIQLVLRSANERKKEEEDEEEETCINDTTFVDVVPFFSVEKNLKIARTTLSPELTSSSATAAQFSGRDYLCCAIRRYAE